MDPTERSRRAAAGEPVAQAIAGPAWATSGPLMDRIRAGEFAAPIVRDWRDQIQRISDDVCDLQASRSVVERLQVVIENNPRLQPWNYLLDRIFRWYASSSLVMVYRDVDRTKNTVGLRRLVEDVARHPEELTRDRFRRLHTGSAQPAERTNDPDSVAAYIMWRDLEECYATIADKTGYSLDVGMIHADRDELITAADEVEKARNSVYAHRAAGGPALASIRLTAIHQLVDILDRLVNKYRKILLYEPYLDGHTPVDQTNWPEILTFPWILPRDRDTSVPYAATPELLLKMFAALRPDEQAQIRNLLR